MRGFDPLPITLFNTCCCAPWLIWTAALPQYRSMGYKMVDLICDYYQSVEKYPVRPQVQVGSSGAQSGWNLVLACW